MEIDLFLSFYYSVGLKNNNIQIIWTDLHTLQLRIRHRLEKKLDFFALGYQRIPITPPLLLCNDLFLFATMLGIFLKFTDFEIRDRSLQCTEMFRYECEERTEYRAKAKN